MAGLASASPPPNQWVVLVDHSKVLITLATALLGVTVTFSDKLVVGNPGQAHTPLMILWVLLVFGIVLGVLSVAFAVNYLRKGKRDGLAVFCANAAFGALVLAGIALVWLGYLRFKSEEHIIVSDFYPGQLLPAFPSASSETFTDLQMQVCAIRADFAGMGIVSAVVVGHHDYRELSLRSRNQVPSNPSLATRRANLVAELLTNTSACKASRLSSALPISAGPQLAATELRGITGSALELATASDRRASVYGIRYQQTAIGATGPNRR